MLAVVLAAACGLPPAERDTDDVIARAYETRATNLQVHGTGVVLRILRDDNEGSRHQRFILQLAEGRTLLIVHNIDVAPRVPVEEGDEVSFNGEYEWNEQGGVLHWTHRADRRDHVDGWLEHNGRRYD